MLVPDVFWLVRQVKLKDSVVSALQFAKAKDIELAWINARIDLSKAKTDTSATYVNEYGVTVKMLVGGWDVRQHLAT